LAVYINRKHYWKQFFVLKSYNEYDCRGGGISIQNRACLENTINNKTLDKIDKNRAELA